jgi:hypothetical protein
MFVMYKKFEFVFISTASPFACKETSYMTLHFAAKY